MNDKTRRRVLRFSRFICLLLRLMGRLEVRGVQNIPHGGFVAAGNHRSTADGIVAFRALIRHGNGQPVVFMATRGVFRIPVVGKVMLRMGFIPVHRGDTRTATTGQVALEGAQAAVKDGCIMGMYPRGGISTAENVRRMKGGVFRLYEAGATVVPMVSTGAERLIPPGCWFPRFWRTVTIEFMPPVSPGLDKATMLATLDHTLYGA
ncbi:MAG TPA: lysophospholipid acyltransferase family protein [Candidatus Saccharimonadales bacterium]|nr:lysophospholipid acyltransferase family protein [Candidatus Saccharimonadales bacterium]